MTNTHETLTSLFTAIADAIRTKTGGTDKLVADKFPEEIAGISTGMAIETCTVTGGPFSIGQAVYFTNAEGEIEKKEYGADEQFLIVCQKNTIIAFQDAVVGNFMVGISGGIEPLDYEGALSFAVTSDGAIWDDD